MDIYGGNMINGINHITISVKNIETAFLFYKNILKLKPIMKSNKSAYFLAGEIWIALDQRDEYILSKNYSHICFNISEKLYGKFIKNLRKEGIREWKANDTEGDSIYILDDSENKLELHFSRIEERIKYGKENWGKDVKWFV